MVTVMGGDLARTGHCRCLATWTVRRAMKSIKPPSTTTRKLARVILMTRAPVVANGVVLVPEATVVAAVAEVVDAAPTTSLNAAELEGARVDDPL